jgi:hypothetical protein
MTENSRGFWRLAHALPMLSLLIAGLSLASSITQSINYRKNIESVQQNVLRAENLKTCRDIIDVFFAYRLKAEEANARALKASLSADQADSLRRDMKIHVYRFGALGTYLANFTPDSARERYSKLSWLLNSIAEQATSLTLAEFQTQFAQADAAFSTLNDDCVKSTQFQK